jgi:hypothetical protein
MKEKSLTNKGVKEETKKEFKIGNVFINTFLAVGMLGLLLCAIAWPLASIWALNQIFGLSIQYTFLNWLACWVLILTIQGACRIKNT